MSCSVAASTPHLSPHTSSSSRRYFSSSATASVPFKRKRPSAIDIPPTLSSTFYSPHHLPPVEVVEVDEDPFFAVYSKRGKRGATEDRFSHLLNIHGNPKQALFGVFDGHGGERAAEFASRRMNVNIIEEMGNCSGGGEGEVEEAVRRGYLKTDSEFLEEEGEGGTCCVTAFIKDGFLVASNVGDCRAVVSRKGAALALTSDHRPSRVDERSRIESMGGYVDFFHGAWRINGSLGVSRAIGDGKLKPWVTAEPETRIIRIEEEDEFLILASDGLWEKVGNQEGVDVVGDELGGKFDGRLSSACRRIGEMASLRGCTDDITVVVVLLPNFI